MPKQSVTARRTHIGPNLFQRGQRFYLIANVNGHQVVEALDAPNKTDAKILRDKRLGELRSPGQVVVKDRNLTFDHLAELWAEYEAGPSGKLRARTLDLRRMLLRKHIAPVLGSKKVAAITVVDLRVLVDRLNRKGLSGSSVRGIITTVSVVLNYGARFGYVRRNAVSELVKDDLPSARRETEPRYLNRDEVQRLFSHLGPEFKVIAQTLFYGALRASEALALEWRDVALDDGLLHIRRGKTEASVAAVPLHPALGEILKAHRQTQAAKGLQWINATTLVFPTITGRPQSRRNLLRAINTASTNAGLDVQQERERDGKMLTVHVGPHDLRHSIATLVHAEGFAIEQISELLRHASTSITERVYLGKLKPQKERAKDLGRSYAALLG